MADLKTIAQDPEFQKLPIEEQRKAFAEYDKDFAGLPVEEQDKGIKELTTKSAGPTKSSMPFWKKGPLLFAEGFNKGLANVLGTPVDLANMVLGLEKYGNTEPILGSKWFSKNMLPAQTVKPEGFTENILSATGEQLPYFMPGAGQAGEGMNLLTRFRQALMPVIKPSILAGTGVGTARTVAPNSPEAELIGQVAAITAPSAPRAVANMMQPKGRKLIESGVKFPPTSVTKGERDKIVNTIIDKDVKWNEQGWEWLNNKISGLNTQIDDLVKGMKQTRTEIIPGMKSNVFVPEIEKYPQGAGYTIKTGPNQYIMDHGAPRIFLKKEDAQPLLDNLKSQLPKDIGPTTREVGAIPMQEAADYIDEVVKFYENLPAGRAKEYIKPLKEIKQEFLTETNITPERAQKMKKTLYKILKDTYGEFVTSGKGYKVEADKAVARGLKDAINKREKGIAPLNAEEAELLNLKEVMEPSLNRIRNYDVVRLGDSIMAVMGAHVGGVPGAMAASGTKGILEHPALKVEMGKKLHRIQRKPLSLPDPLSRALAAYGVTLGDAYE